MTAKAIVTVQKGVVLLHYLIQSVFYVSEDGRLLKVKITTTKHIYMYLYMYTHGKNAYYAHSGHPSEIGSCELSDFIHNI